MEGYSGSDIRLVCKEAAMRPVRKIFDALESHQEGGIANTQTYSHMTITRSPDWDCPSQEMPTFPPSSWKLWRQPTSWKSSRTPNPRPETWWTDTQPGRESTSLSDAQGKKTSMLTLQHIRNWATCKNLQTLMLWAGAVYYTVFHFVFLYNDHKKYVIISSSYQLSIFYSKFYLWYNDKTFVIVAAGGQCFWNACFTKIVCLWKSFPVSEIRSDLWGL